MGLRSVDGLTDAFEATREFLTPVDAEQWAKLAFVVFFLWGTAGSGTPSSDATGGGNGPPDSGVSVDLGNGFGTTAPIEEFGSLDGDLLAALIVIVAASLLLGIAYLFVGSVMEFVFVESLRSEAVAVRAYWREHLRRGVRLFAFRLVFSVGVLAIGIGLVALLVGPVLFEPAAGFPTYVAFLVLLPILLFLGVVAAVVNEFTTVFVVPVMLVEGRSVLDAWRRLWGVVRTDPAEFLAYAGLKLVLSLVAGAVVGALVAIPAIVLFLPVGVLGGIAVLGGDPSVLTVLAVVVFGLIALVVLLALTAVVQVPVVTYFRYYALLVLGDVDADLDLIPDRRAAIRDEDSPDPNATDDESGGPDAANDDRGRAGDAPDDDRGRAGDAPDDERDR